MQKNMFIRWVVMVVGILLLMILAYGHSAQVLAVYNQRMQEDIQFLTLQMMQQGFRADQIMAFRTVFLEINQNTMSLIASEVFNIVGMLSVMGIIIASFTLRLSGKIAAQKGADCCPTKK